jgi:hypothetical protein
MTRKSMSLVLFLTAAVSFLGCSPSKPVQNAKSTDELPTRTKVENEGSPEAALRQFLWARAIRHPEALAEVVLQTEYLDMMLRGGPASPEDAAMTLQMINRYEIRALKVGHKLNLAGGRTFELTESHINENRRQLAVSRDPFPFDVIRVNGKWKVNVEVGNGEPPPEVPPKPRPADPPETTKS